MKELVKDGGVAGGSGNDGITEENAAPVMKSLPTKAQGRPLLLGAELDKSLQDYISALRVAGGGYSINTAIVQDSALGSRSWITPTTWWPHRTHQSLGQISAEVHGICQKKGIDAGKITVLQFKEIQEEF